MTEVFNKPCPSIIWNFESRVVVNCLISNIVSFRTAPFTKKPQSRHNRVINKNS